METLITRHYGMLRAFIRLRVDSATRAHESVSDLVQSVCREVLVRADRFEFQGEPAFRAWLCEAALRKLRDRRAYHAAQRRDAKREQRTPTERLRGDDLAALYRTTFDPVGRALRDEEVECLERAFDTLSDDLRQALTLRQICELPYADIAQAMDRSEVAVRKLVSRARAQLAERMSDWLPDN